MDLNTYPRQDIATNGAISQVVYLTKTLTLQGGYTATNFTTPYPITQPTVLDALDSGRVIYITGDITPTINNLSLVGGNATTFGGASAGNAGGGLYVMTASVTLNALRILSNQSDYGSAIYVASGDVTMTNTTIAHNQVAQPNAAVYAQQATVQGTHITLAENNSGAALYLAGGSNAQLANTIIVSHTAGVTTTPGSTAAFSAILWNNTTDWSGTGITHQYDVYGDAAFVDPAASDYHIGVQSAAIDRGLNAFGLPVDFEDEERPVGQGYDLGADEFPAALRVTKSVEPAEIIAGDTITYTLHVTNTGHVALYAYINDNLPAQVTPSGRQRWEAFLPADGGAWTQSLVVTVLPEHTGLLSNTGCVTTLVGVGDIYTLAVNVAVESDLVINKAASANAVEPNQPFMYTLNYVNNGPSTAAGVMITDNIPTEMLSVTLDTYPVLTPLAGHYIWDVGTLAPQTGGTITISGVLSTGLHGGFLITNSAQIAATTPDNDIGNNTSEPVVVSVLDVSPIVQDDVATILEDNVAHIFVLDNDIDLNGDTLRVTFVSNPAHGIATILNESVVIYTPTQYYNGSDTFTYRVTDGSYIVIADINVTVTPVNTPPLVVPDSVTTTEDMPITISVLDNDSDVDSATITLHAVGEAVSGTTTLDSNSVLYTPLPNIHGVDVFTYTVTDSEGAYATTHVTVTVTPVDDLPVANDDSVNTPADTARYIFALANDVDVDGQTLSMLAVSTPPHGAANIVDYLILYTPTLAFNGLDTFTYTISDGGLTAWANITVAVGNPNSPPVAVDDTLSVTEDTITLLDVLANDTDVDNDPLYIAALGASAQTSTDGATITYTPLPNFVGQEVFTYTMSDGLWSDTAHVTVTVTAVNDAPQALADDYFVTVNTSLVVAAPGVLTNDSDVETPLLTALLVNAPLSGLLHLAPDGGFIYTPTVNFSGPVSFTYAASDGDLTDTALVNLSVSFYNAPPTAVPDSVTTLEEVAITIPVLTNDVDEDSPANWAIAAVGTPLSGSVVISGVVLYYTPWPNLYGVEVFTYTMTDGNGGYASTNVNVTIIPVNDAPSATDDIVSTPENTARYIYVLGNDVDVDNDLLTIVAVSTVPNGAVTIVGPNLLYTPTLDFSGTDTLSYTISDGTVTSWATVTVMVGGANTPPVAVDDIATTIEDTPLALAVLDNDIDTDNDPLFITAFGLPERVTKNGPTLLTYTPAPEFSGQEVFTYTMSDGLWSDTGRVTVTVTAFNDAPVAVADKYRVALNTPLVVPTPGVLANDTDVDSPALTALLDTSPASGTVQLNAAGSFIYTPTLDSSGVVTFTYVANDGLSASNVTFVRLTIGDANLPPTVEDATLSTTENAPINGTIVADDLEGDALTYTTVVSPLYGDLTWPGNSGTWLYKPTNRSSSYVDTFDVMVSDGSLNATAQVTLNVTADNDTPVFTTTPVTQALVGTQYVYSAIVVDPDVDANLAVTVTSKPAWLATTQGAAMLTFRGTPSVSEIGTWRDITLHATDGLLTVTQRFDIEVYPPPDFLLYLPLIMRSTP